MADNNKDINLHGHVSVTTEAGKAIELELQTIWTQIGLGATAVGFATVVSKGIIKTQMPPLQRVGAAVARVIIGGLVYSKLSRIKNNINIKNDIMNNVCSSNSNGLNGDDLISSPLEGLLLDLELTNYVCVYMLIVLIIQIFFKLHLTNSLRLNLNWILGNKLNNNLEFYINKIISLNKKLSMFYILLILFPVIIGLSSSIYAIHDIQNNLDDYIFVYKSMKGK